MHIVSSTKDSVHIGWHIYDQYQPHIQGFKIQYQAEGSNIVQYTPMLEPDEKNHDIQNLHENTYYKMCLRTFTDLNLTSTEPCVRATTSVDSLHVALGSTFGAFLALGIIVLFVFIAKWQNTRKLKKQLRNISPTDEQYDTMPQNDADIELSDVSLNVDAQSTKVHDANSCSSQVSGYHSATSRKSIPNSEGHPDGGRRGSEASKARRKSSQSTHSNANQPPHPPTISPPPEPTKNSKIRKQKSTDSQHSLPHAKTSDPLPTQPEDVALMGDSNTSPADNNTAFQNAKRDYGGARPKEFSPNDPRNLYANKAYMELPTQENTGLKPNLSCKW